MNIPETLNPTGSELRALAEEVRETHPLLSLQGEAAFTDKPMHVLKAEWREFIVNAAPALARAVMDMQREIAGHAALEEIAKEGAERFREQLAAKHAEIARLNLSFPEKPA